MLTGSVPPVPQFPRAGAVIWPGSQPGLRGLNSCFVPAVLLRRCSGKANIPRPGVYRLAAPSLPPPARGTGRGAAPVPGGTRGAAPPPSCPRCPGGLTGPLRGPRCSPCSPNPGMLHILPPSHPAPALWAGQTPGGGRGTPQCGGVPSRLAAAPACFAAQLGRRAGARGGATSIPHIFKGSESQWDAAPVAPRLCNPAARLRPGCSY